MIEPRPAASRRVWKFVAANWHLFSDVLQQANMVKGVMDSVDSDTALLSVVQSILEAATIAIPSKVINAARGRRCQPWVTTELRNLWRRKKEVFDRHKRSGSRTDKQAYEKLRKKCRKVMATAQRQYYESELGDCSNIGQFFRAVKRAMGKQPKAIPALRCEDGSMAVSDAEKAELLQSHLCSVFNNNNCSKLTQPATPSNHECQLNWLCNVDFVQQLILSMPNNKSVGSDGIHPIMLKCASTIIAPAICTLINKVMRNTIVPNAWKHSTVTPIPKFSAPSAPSDYRGIGIQPMSNKFFEKHLYNILFEFISPHLNIRQFGFQRRRGTVDALGFFQYEVCNFWLFCTTVACVYFDLSKAFDLLDHVILLQILRDYYHVPEHILKILHNLLYKRSQTVRVGNAYSSPMYIESGVIQGSIIGPLLFLAFVNSVLSLDLKSDASIVMYADDIALLTPISSASSYVDVQHNVDAVVSHFTSKNLTINKSKTKLQLFHRGHSALAPPTPITVHNSDIEVVNSHKYLGVILDNKLDFAANTRLRAARTKKCVGALVSCTRNTLSKPKLSFLYKTLFLPYLLYACEIVYPVHTKDRTILERVNKFASRLICNNFARNVSYDFLLSSANLSSIYRIVFARKLILMYKYIHHLRFIIPNCISFMRERACSSRLNHFYTIDVGAFCANRRQNYCMYNLCARAFNILPFNVVTLPLSQFKRKIGAYFDDVLFALRTNRVHLCETIDI